MASLKKRNNIYYLTFKQTINGEQLEKTFSLRTKKKRIAQKLKTQLETEFEKGQLDPFNNFNFLDWKFEEETKTGPQFITLSKAIEEFLQSSNQHSKKTTKHYNSLLGRFEKRVGSTMPLKRISKEDIDGFRKIPPANSSKNNYLRHLRSFLNWAKEQKYIADNPASDLNKFSTKDTLSSQILRENELITLIKKFKEVKDHQEKAGYIHSDQQRQLWFKPLTKTLFYSGLRIEEALNLRWRDINLKNDELIVHNGKGNKSRSVVIFSSLNKCLTKWEKKISSSPEDLVFPSPKLNCTQVKMTRRNVSRIFKKYVRKVNYNDNLCTHSLRHSSATYMLRKGFNVFDVKKMLGHSSIETTLKYVHLTMGDIKKKAKNLNL